jgi:hypothetical protein
MKNSYLCVWKTSKLPNGNNKTSYYEKISTIDFSGHDRTTVCPRLGALQKDCKGT